MQGKIMGAIIERTFGELTVKAVPLPYFEFAPYIAEHRDDVIKIGAKVMPYVIVSAECEGLEQTFTIKTVAGLKKRVVSAKTLSNLPPNCMPKLLP